ncbi:hypothetical protein D021_0844A, partial [Vibrio parahaemolyticus 10296]
MSLPFL